MGRQARRSNCFSSHTCLSLLILLHVKQSGALFVLTTSSRVASFYLTLFVFFLGFPLVSQNAGRREERASHDTKGQPPAFLFPDSSCILLLQITCFFSFSFSFSSLVALSKNEFSSLRVSMFDLIYDVARRRGLCCCCGFQRITSFCSSCSLQSITS